MVQFHEVIHELTHGRTAFFKRKVFITFSIRNTL